MVVLDIAAARRQLRIFRGEDDVHRADDENLKLLAMGEASADALGEVLAQGAELGWANRVVLVDGEVLRRPIRRRRRGSRARVGNGRQMDHGVVPLNAAFRAS